MGLKDAIARAANENRKFFITNCIKFDTPRLASEKYPEDVSVAADIAYTDKPVETDPLADEKYELCVCDRVLDIYTPANAKDDEMFILFHGGAFAYGCKELDKNFCMHLAQASGIAVANIGYRLLPHTNLKGLLTDLFEGISYLVREKNIRKFHTTGDSAGGYLAVLVAILLNSTEARKECGLSEYDTVLAGGDGVEPVRALTTNPICGSHRHHPRRFCGIYFDPEKQMPSYIYDLTKAIKLYGCPPVSMCTGDFDDMQKENAIFLKFLNKAGIPVLFDKAVSVDDRRMHHVYQIAHPDWPESQHVIEMICKNAGAGK